MQSGWRQSRKRNCTLNWPLGILQLSRAPLIVNLGSVAVITCAVRMCHGAACESRKFPPAAVSHYQCNSECGGTLFSALSHIVCAYYAHIKTAHKLGYLYTYWRERDYVVACLLEQCLCGPMLM